MSHLRCLWPLYCIVNRKNNNRNNCMPKGVAHIAGMVVFRFQVELMELFVKLLVGLLVKLLLGCEGESKNVGDMWGFICGSQVPSEYVFTGPGYFSQFFKSGITA